MHKLPQNMHKFPGMIWKEHCYEILNNLWHTPLTGALQLYQGLLHKCASLLAMVLWVPNAVPERMSLNSFSLLGRDAGFCWNPLFRRTVLGSFTHTFLPTRSANFLWVICSLSVKFLLIFFEFLLRFRRPATGVSRAFGPKCPRECPQKRGCLTECPTGCPHSWSAGSQSFGWFSVDFC